MTLEQSPEEAHRILWGNVQSLREALRNLAKQEMQSGDDEGGRARIFVESKVAEIPRGSSWGELWDSLELLYRRITGVAVEAMLRGLRQGGLAFIGSAGMLLGLLRPDLSDDERHEELMASLDKRTKEQET